MATVDEVLQAAMSLNDQQRQLVADLLWGSVDVASPLHHDDEERAAITAELRQAWDDYQSGVEIARPWSELKERLLRDEDRE